MTDLKPDIVRLILSDHETFRELAAHLEVHASAEEAHFYPALLKKVDDSEDETRDAIHDHDEIREGIRRAAAAEAGSDEWWAGIQDAREANDEHLAEEERDKDPDDFVNQISCGVGARGRARHRAPRRPRRAGRAAPEPGRTSPTPTVR